jgi:hypothetical protein
LSASYTIRQFESLYTHLLNLRFRKEAEVLFLKKTPLENPYLVYYISFRSKLQQKRQNFIFFSLPKI